jgi:hypothetical protein
MLLLTENDISIFKIVTSPEPEIIFLNNYEGSYLSAAFSQDNNFMLTAAFTKEDSNISLDLFPLGQNKAAFSYKLRNFKNEDFLIDHLLIKNK